MDLLSELPLGFGMALAKNTKAMERFTSLPDEQKRMVIEGTHNINSKKEMQLYVANLLNRSYF